MRPRHSLARGLLWAAALVTFSFITAAAPAAPAKRHKPKPAPKSAPAATDDDPMPPKADDSAKAAPDSEVAPKVDDSTPPKADEAPAKVDAPPPVDVAPVKPEPTTESHDEPVGGNDDELLGRRERQRVAAGRYEVAISASVDGGNRRFKYSDPVGPLPAPYRLPIAPMLSVGLEAYPFASSNVPGLRDFGFRGRFSRAFAVDSKTPEGVTIETSWTRFGGDVRQRFLLPGSHPFELGVYLGADASYFTMKTKTPVAALFPAAKTVAVRVGFDARLLVAGQFSLLLGGAYLAVTSPGEIYDRFRSPHVHGLDGEFGAALGVLPGFELRLMSRYTRYFSTFKPRIGDAIVAGGALDEQLQFGLGARYAH